VSETASATVQSPKPAATSLSSVLALAQALIAADAFAVWSLDSATGTWSITQSIGLSDTYTSAVVISGESGVPQDIVAIEDLSETDFPERIQHHVAEGIRSMMVAPIMIKDVPAGTIVFYFRTTHKFSEQEEAHARALGQLTSSALTATALYREQTEAKRVSDFVADAGKVLASSLDYEVTISTVARFVVEDFADWCAVDVLEGGALKRLAVAHVDPAKVEFAARFQREYPVQLNSERGEGRVLATGLPELYAEVTDAMLVAAARDPRHLQLLRDLGMHSAMIVPLIARGATIGAMTLVSAESGRRFSERDLMVAEELANRAATAIDNARLFRALQESEQKFRAVSETASCGIYIHNGQKLLYVNSAAQALAGYTREEFLQQDMWDLIHPDDRPLARARAAARFRGEDVPARYEFRALRKDGSVMWLDFSAAMVDFGGERALLATAFDISDRKLAEERLHRTELEARTLLRNLPDVVSRYAPDLRYLYISPAVERATGRPASEFIGKTHEEIGIPEELCARFNASLRRIFETGEPDNIEFSMEAPDGTVRHYVGAGVPEVAREGVVESVLTITRDITESKTAQDRLLRSEGDLRLITDTVPALVAYIDANQRFRRINRPAEQWFGMPISSIIGMSIPELLGDNYEHVRTHVERVLSGQVAQFETTNQYKDKTRHVFITYTPDFDEEHSVRGFVALVADITDRRIAEDALRKSEKLAAAGRLAASIAHEINNPLESVTNLVFLAKNDPGLTASGKEYLALAEDELRRVSHIATQTLRFHRQATRPAKVNIEELLDSVLTLYERRLRDAQVGVERRYFGSGDIAAFDGELRQLFANLIGNALEASRPGCRILLRTRGFECDGRRGVRVTIADTGHGIAPLLLSRIFEPFFTTKPSTGTGLGLWVSREIVDKHHGSIRVRSSERPGNSGTVFVLALFEVSGS